MTLQDWINTLRSDKYKQGKHFLRRAENTFCCLGVLCDIVNPTLWSDEAEENKYEHTCPTISRFTYDGHNTQLLPSDISEKYGIDGNVQDVLSQWNDNTGIGFAGIADLIEKHATDLTRIPPPHSEFI